MDRPQQFNMQKIKKQENLYLKQERYGSYLLSRLLYNTLGMNVLVIFWGQDKVVCFQGRREYLCSMVGGNKRRKT